TGPLAAVVVVPSSAASFSLRAFCSSLALTIANAIVVATIAAKSAINPSMTARFGGNRSAPRIPTNAISTAAATSTMPMTKKKSPFIRRGSYPEACSGRVGEAPARAHRLVGELERIAAPDEQPERPLALRLGGAAEPAIVKQRDGAAELSPVVVRGERRIDLVAGNPAAFERGRDPVGAPAGELALVLRIAAGRGPGRGPPPPPPPRAQP